MVMYYVMMEFEEKVFISYKFICVGLEEKVVGLYIMGLGSGEMFQGFGVVVKMGVIKVDFDSCVVIYLISVEEFVILRQM